MTREDMFKAIKEWTREEDGLRSCLVFVNEYPGNFGIGMEGPTKDIIAAITQAMLDHESVRSVIMASIGMYDLLQQDDKKVKII